MEVRVRSVMVSSLEVLIDSFRHIVREPKLFLPKLFSTVLSSVFLILVIEKGLAMIRTSPSLKFLAAFFPVIIIGSLIIGIIGVTASLMVSSMVKNGSEKAILSTSWEEVKSLWKEVVMTAGIFYLLGFFVVIPLFLGVFLTPLLGPLSMILGGLISLVFIVAVIFSSYFLPITLLEEKSLIQGFSTSFDASRENPRQVMFLTFFSLMLLAVASLSSSGNVKAAGYLGFFAGRLLSTIVNTYLFVVSPKFYLEN